MNELPRHDFRNNLRLTILGNEKIPRKLLRYLDLIASTHPAHRKTNFDIYNYDLRNISCKIFHRKP